MHLLCQHLCAQSNHQVPEWADAYINYKLLKKLLNAIDVKNRLHERIRMYDKPERPIHQPYTPKSCGWRSRAQK